MKTRVLVLGLVIAASALPQTASAQRGGGGGGRGGPRGGRGGGMPEIPAAIEIDKLDPIALLISNQKDLELTPVMVGKLTELDADLIRATKPALAAVDSLKAAVKEAGTSDRAAVRDGMGSYNRVVSDIRTQSEDAIKKALDLLTGEPRKRAEKLLDDRNDKFDKVTRARAPDSE